jgi:hypothetical protein
MDISSSIISKLFNKWGDVEHCPYQLYRVAILRDIHMDTLAMQKGRYFETQCLGSTAFGNEDDLPRLRNGEKSTDHKRIDECVMLFEQQCRNHFVEVNKWNTQVVLKMKLNSDYNYVGHLDIFPVAMYDKTFHMAFIDLKLAEDSGNTWGDFCWGKPEYINTTQMVGYHTLIRHMDNDLNDLDGVPDAVLELAHTVRGYYWVFGYRKGGFLPLEVTYTPDKVAEFRESVRRTMSTLTKYEAEGWKPTPGKLCGKCPVLTCPARDTIQKI